MKKRADIFTIVYFVMGFVLMLAFTVFFLLSQVNITGMLSYETPEGIIMPSSIGWLVVCFLIFAMIFFILALNRTFTKPKKAVKKKK